MESIFVHMNTDNTFMLCCPHCGFEKQLQLDQLKTEKHTFVVRCKCKNRFQVNLNFRKCYRKNVTLPGKFKILSSKAPFFLEMTICNISKSGIGFKIIKPANIHKGDSLKVTFNLDNAKETLIDRNVIVRMVRNDFLGCEFTELDLYDKELGFYLMP